VVVLQAVRPAWALASVSVSEAVALAVQALGAAVPQVAAQVVEVRAGLLVPDWMPQVSGLLLAGQPVIPAKQRI